MEKTKATALIHALLFACFLSACGSSPPANSNGFSVSTPQISDAKDSDAPPSSTRTTPRTLEIKLTVSRVEDLKIKQGQHIAAGDVLTERLIERAPLEAQRSQAQVALQMFVQPKRAPLPRLVPAFYADAETTITRAEKAEQDARRKVETTAARIAELERISSMPPSIRATVKEHETASHDQLERDGAAAESELGLARAQLENARAVRSTAEYMTARDAAMQQNTEEAAEKSAAKEAALLRAQIASLDYQIGLLGVVRAPFAGTIKRMGWEGQQDHDVTVVLSVAVDEPDTKPNTKRAAK